MRAEAMDFIEAMVEKAMRKAIEHDRPTDPWNHFTPEFLNMRMGEELQELMEADLEGNLEGVMDELLDVANFAMFRWIQIKKQQEGK